MNPKDPRISIRVPIELKERILRVVNDTGIDEATIVRNCIEALCEHVEETGEITFPLSVTTKKRAGVAAHSLRRGIDSALNEPAAPVSYRKNKPTKP